LGKPFKNIASSLQENQKEGREKGAEGGRGFCMKGNIGK